MRKLLSLLLVILIFSCEKQDLPIEDVLQLPDSITAYGGALNDVAQSVVATSDGGFAVLGYTQSNDGDITDKGDTSFDFWLLKFNSNAE